MTEPIEKETPAILPSLPSLKETAMVALLLAALAGLHVADLWRQGMRLSTTPFIDPAGVIQVTAWDVYSLRRFSEGCFPLWNPYTGLGQPHLANLQTAVFYPLKLPFYLIGGIGGHDLYLYLRLVLLGLGPFVLLRAMGVGRAGAILAAVSFGLGSYALWFVNLVELNNQVLTPFLMIALARLASGYTIRRFLAASALVAMDFLGGHPEGIFVTILFSGLFAMHMNGWKKGHHTFVKLLPAGILGVMSATVVLIPFVEYFPRAWNLHFPGLGFLHLGAQSPITTLSPFLKDLIDIPMWSIPKNALEMSLWDFYKLPYNDFRYNWGLPALGVIATAFAISAGIRWRFQVRGTGFFVVFWLCAVLFSMGLFPMKLLSFLPPFNVTNNAKFYFAEIALSGSMLAGIGLDGYLKKNTLIIPILSAGFMALIILLVYCFRLNASESLMQMLPAIVFIGVAIKMPQKMSVAAVTFVLIESGIMRMNVRPYVPIDWNESLSASWLKEIPSGPNSWIEGRMQVMDDYLLTPNLNLVTEHADIRSSDAMFPLAYFNWMAQAGGYDRDQAMRDFYPRYYTKLNDKAIVSQQSDSAGLKYIVSINRLIGLDKYSEKYIDGVYIYENTNVNSRSEGWQILTNGVENFLFQRINELSTFSPLNYVNNIEYPGWYIFKISNKHALSEFDVANINEGEKFTVVFRPISFSLGIWLGLTTFCIMFFILFTIKYHQFLGEPQ